MWKGNFVITWLFKVKVNAFVKLKQNVMISDVAGKHNYDKCTEYISEQLYTKQIKSKTDIFHLSGPMFLEGVW